MVLVRARLAAAALVALPLLLGAVASPTTASANPGANASVTTPAAPGRTAAAEHLQRDGEFSMNVRYTVCQTGTTYDVDGWSRPPATRQRSTDTTDAHGNFHIGRYESYEPRESGLVRTAARAGSSVAVAVAMST